MQSLNCAIPVHHVHFKQKNSNRNLFKAPHNEKNPHASLPVLLLLLHWGQSQAPPMDRLSTANVLRWAGMSHISMECYEKSSWYGKYPSFVRNRNLYHESFIYIIQTYKYNVYNIIDLCFFYYIYLNWCIMGNMFSVAWLHLIAALSAQSSTNPTSWKEIDTPPKMILNPPCKTDHFKGNVSSSNHQFSNELLVLRGVNK